MSPNPDDTLDVNVPSRALILTAIGIEFKAVCDNLTSIRKESHKGNIYHIGKFSSGLNSWDVMVAETGMGNSIAATETERAISYFKPRIAIFVGVAGGIKDVKIGDVVAATKIYNYESARAGDKFHTRPELCKSSYSMKQLAKTESSDAKWLERIKSPKLEPIPNVYVKPIASGDKLITSMDSRFYGFLKENYSDAVAVEMEGYGFLYAVESNSGVDGIVIRGISDLIERKGESDASGTQEIAARHASAFAFELLSEFNLDDDTHLIHKSSLSVNSSSETLQNKKSVDSMQKKPEDETLAVEKDLSSKVRTLVVGKQGRHNYKEIAVAIKDANPGDRIKILPGDYDESLIIDKPNLEIIGEGNRKNIIIRAKGQEVISFKTTSGRVANLTLQQMGGNVFCVDIAQGILELENCDIISQGIACVGIHDEANPRLSHNLIHDSKQSGVFIFNKGFGTLEDNEIFRNTYSGIEIAAYANPMLRHNIIRDGKQSGVFVHDRGYGILEENDIFGNVLAGIEIKNEANPTLRRNKIHHNQKNGILIQEYGLGVLEENEIYGNEYDGVGVRSFGNPTMRRNRIFCSKQGGIFFFNNAYGTLEENDIFENRSDGVAIREASNPTLRRNRIFDGKSNGIYIWESGLGLFEDNDVFGNFHGIEIKSESNPAIRGNLIRDNKQAGVLIQENGSGVFENNEIFGNAFSGIEITTRSNPTIDGNNICDGKQNGVLIHHDGRGIIKNNDIVGNTFSGIEINTAGDPVIENNNINSNYQSAVIIHTGGKGVIMNNDLRNNIKGAFTISEDCTLVKRDGNIE